MEKEDKAGKLLTLMKEGNFKQIISPEKYKNFQLFIDQRAKLSGGFVAVRRLEEGSLIWFHYKSRQPNLLDMLKGSSRFSFEGFYAPTEEDPANFEMPKELVGLPVWWLE